MASLTRNRTLRRLYVDPLVNILEGQNPVTEFFDGDEEGEAEGGKRKRKMGVFDTDPEQTLVLLIDFKTDGHETWPAVVAALEPLRERGYLSHRNGSTIVEGPITVVATGNAPFELVLNESANQHLDIFFDAPLGEMFEALPSSTSSSSSTSTPSSSSNSTIYTHTSHNSYYASTKFSAAIGHLPTGKFSTHQLSLLRGQIRGAHSRGLKARYWDLPFWPIGLRNYVWRVLVEEGVDILNVDDLEGVKGDWGEWRGWWRAGG